MYTQYMVDEQNFSDTCTCGFSYMCIRHVQVHFIVHPTSYMYMYTCTLEVAFHGLTPSAYPNSASTTLHRSCICTHAYTMYMYIVYDLRHSRAMCIVHVHVHVHVYVYTQNNNIPQSQVKVQLVHYIYACKLTM